MSKTVLQIDNQAAPVSDNLAEKESRSQGHSPVLSKLSQQKIVYLNDSVFIQRLIAGIDRAVSQQLSEIIHHARFEAIEASWRSLLYLVALSYKQPKIKIRVLDLARKELATDLKQALEFDQSVLFNKIYGEEFGMPGGQPYGVLIGDYEFSHQPDDIEVLQVMSQISAASFAPFIAAAASSMFSLNDVTELEKQPKLETIFKQPQYLRWNSFRRQEDSRFVGLTLPRFLVRDAYQHANYRFCFQDTKPESAYLWGNASYAFAGVLIQAFENDGWLANIRGYTSDVLSGGVVPPYETTSFKTDKAGLIPKMSTDVLITDTQEKQLSDLGFIPLCRAFGDEMAVFYSNASIQSPKTYNSLAADQNALTSTMLQHMFCACRFAHYLKVIGRDKVGSFISAEDHELYLNRWLMQYVASNTDLKSVTRRRYPLQAAKVQVRERIGKPGSYSCVIQLKPCFQLEQVVTNITLVTELVSVVNM